MPICKTARFAVRPEALEACKQAIRELVLHIKASEPGTRLYLSLQEQADPTRFRHVMIFDDEAAEGRHRSSDAVKKFTGVIYPATLQGVEFTTYAQIASNV